MLVASLAFLIVMMSAFFLVRPTLVREIQTQGLRRWTQGKTPSPSSRFQLANKLMFGNDANVHFNLGNAYELVGINYKTAEAEYQQALGLDDTHTSLQ